MNADRPSGMQRPNGEVRALSKPARRPPKRGASVPGSLVTENLGSDVPARELTPKVRAALEHLQGEVDRLRQDLAAAHQRLEYLQCLSDLDPLVPLINRRAFMRELKRFIGLAQRYGNAGSLVFFDVDDLKSINDVEGHGAGDAALISVAGALLDHVRGSDIVGRLGGDEFSVILVRSTPETAEDTAARLAEQIRDTKFDWKGRRLGVTVSYGVHPILPGQHEDEALHSADIAMYRRKRATA